MAEMTGLKLTPEDIVPYLKAKYPHMYKGNDEGWCRIREDVLLSLLKSYDTELLLEAQLAKDEARFQELLKHRSRPKIVCLCGSTRFTNEMLVKQWELTKQGFVVLSWCALPESYFQGEDKAHIGDQEGVKEIVDEVHFCKIDLADEVVILNIGGYIGESTRNELNYAKKLGKPIIYMEEDNE